MSFVYMPHLVLGIFEVAASLMTMRSPSPGIALGHQHHRAYTSLENQTAGATSLLIYPHREIRPPFTDFGPNLPFDVALKHRFSGYSFYVTELPDERSEMNCRIEGEP